MTPKRINPKTSKGHDLYEISSLVQKSLRRNDVKFALYSSNELMPKYVKYLWKRLLTVSAEDCHDMVTAKILALCRKSEKVKAEEERRCVEEALSILLSARKSRDADYYACNLFNSRDRIDLSKYGQEVFDASAATKNGHNVFFLKSVFDKAIDECDDITAGYAANEIKVYYPNFCWDMIEQKASVKFNSAMLSKEIHALRMTDERTEYSNTLLFRSKAIVLLIALSCGLPIEVYEDKVEHPQVTFDDVSEERLFIPSYTYDCHTLKGKMMGKTKKQFVEAEFNALTPRCEGLYDNASWERFFYNSKHGFYTKEYTPHPSEARVQEIDMFLTTPTIFM